jgi:hypothetical protein
MAPSSPFAAPLDKKTLLGHIRVSLPSTAAAGQSYTLRFSHADGSPDLQTQYDFETKPGSIWVSSPAMRPPDIISDEWKIQFFGSLTSVEADPGADPDGDGVPNWLEYLAGTDPTSANSRLRLEVAPDSQNRKAIALQWLSAPGKRYSLETAMDLSSSDWSVLAENLPGDGTVQEWIHTNVSSTTRFYRIRLQP